MKNNLIHVIFGEVDKKTESFPQIWAGTAWEWNFVFLEAISIIYIK